MEENSKKDGRPSDFIKEEIVVRDYFMKRKSSPDVEEELKRFHANNKTSGRKLIAVCATVAAMLAITAFLYLYVFKKQDSLPMSEQIVYKERSEIEDVLLKSGAAESIRVLDVENHRTSAEGNKPVLIDGGLSYQAISQEAEVQQEVVSVPNGRMFKILLEDGSEVWLNSRSRITFPNRFIGSERKVVLEGEAFFKVAKSQNKRFIVETNGVSTQVLGTEFNVKSSSTLSREVTLLTGKVEVVDEKAHLNTVLTPGEQFVRDVTGTVKVSKIDLDTYYRWYEGYFYFDQVGLGEVLRDIARWYSKDVVFENVAADKLKIRFTADRSEKLETIIDLLDDLKLAKIIIRGNTIVVQ